MHYADGIQTNKQKGVCITEHKTKVKVENGEDTLLF